jgi:hypothetical protein
VSTYALLTNVPRWTIFRIASYILIGVIFVLIHSNRVYQKLCRKRFTKSGVHTALSFCRLTVILSASEGRVREPPGGTNSSIHNDVRRLIWNLGQMWAEAFSFDPKAELSVNVPVYVPFWPRLPFESKSLRRVEVTLVQGHHGGQGIALVCLFC